MKDDSKPEALEPLRAAEAPQPADSAAETAASISAEVESGAFAIISPVAGFVTSVQSLVDDSIQFPLIRFLRISIFKPPKYF